MNTQQNQALQSQRKPSYWQSGVIHVLIVEDRDEDADLIMNMLSAISDDPKYEYTHADCLASAIKILKGNTKNQTPPIDVILTDLYLGDSEGNDTFEAISEQRPDLPIVVMSGFEGDTMAALMVREGAQDYLLKSQLNAAVLGRSLRYAIERHNTEQALIGARFEAEKATEAKSLFLANMSHEIRTPLNGIIGMTDLLIKSQLQGDQKQFVDLLSDCAQSLLTLVNDILDFSKLEANKLDLEPIPFKLRYVINQALSPITVQCQKRELELQKQIDPQIPENLIGDPVRLRQILINLLGNAAKFTENGYVRLEARHITENANNDKECTIEFSIRDTGIGISPDQHKKIFESFSQADGTSTRRYEGTGLGLAISAKLVEIMGGKITLQSEVGNGSCFTFTAKMQKAPETQNVEENHKEPPETTPCAILCLDRDDHSRKALANILQNNNADPTFTDNMPQAIQLLQNPDMPPFDIIMLDSNISKGNIFQTAKNIIETPQAKHIPIALLMSIGQRGDAAKCREIGIRAYLSKPVQASEMKDLISSIRSKNQQNPKQLITRHSFIKPIQKQLQILLVEDNAVNQELAILLLEGKNHKVTVASNGRQALRILQDQKFDIILMDIQMPIMDGVEATVQIRRDEAKHGGHIPIIAMTAHALKGDRERFIAAGMDEYITKPIIPDVLFRTIQEQIQTQTPNNPNTEIKPQENNTDQPPIPLAQFQEDTKNAIDIEALLQRLQDQENIARRVLKAYLHDLPGKIHDLLQAINTQDWTTTQSIAHAIKGASANIAADPLKECARKIEEAAQNTDKEKIEPLAKEANKLSDQIMTALHKILQL